MALVLRRNGDLRYRSPFRELDDLHERMSHLLESSLDQARESAWSPAVDLEETEDAFVVEAELPGVKREDITVELRDNVLTIHGELEERERTGILHRQTRRTGQFDYRVALPGDVNADQVEANLEDGVLRVEARKAEIAKPLRIEIGSA